MKLEIRSKSLRVIAFFVIAFIVLLFPLTVWAGDPMSIGTAAVVGNNSWGSKYTTINYNNPATVAGVITSVQIYAASNLADVKVAVFYGTGETSYVASGAVVPAGGIPFTIQPVDCTLAAGKGALFSEGMIVRIDSEELYISNILNDTLTFQRAADGTTGAAHSAGVIIYLVTNVAYSTRSYAVIGSVIGGSAQTFAVNLNVQAGDYIGMSASSDDNGTMKTSTGGSGLYYALGDNIPCTNYEFSLFQNRKLSLYGAGEAIVVPVSTNPAAPIINIYPFVFVAFIIVGVLLLGIMAAAEHPLYATILLIGIYIIVGLALLTGLQPLINAM